MTSKTAENKRIAKNTLFMYLRMFVTMCIGLYTSRVILRILGVEDYGLQNVIGGIISMFGFINGAMSNATARFLTFSLGKNDPVALNNVFSQSVIIHFSIAVLMLVIGETIGLWYLHNQLVVPEGRMFAAEWLYQLTILTTFLNIMNIPYNAAIIAHERMHAFAYISIMDVVLKLVIVLLLPLIPFDKLISYATLMFFVLVLDRMIYIIYCRKKIPQLKFRYYFDKVLFKKISAYASWNLLGTFAYVFYNQGVNLVINYFCGPAINAARGISHQVEGVIKQFASNVQTAINPQIIKTYAQNDNVRMHSLVFASSRYCFYLLYLLSLPIVIEAPLILRLWLGEFPEHTINFIRIMLLYVIMDAFINPLWTANNATGKIRSYHIYVNSVYLLFIPIIFLSQYFFRIPEIVFVCMVICAIIGIIIRLFILRKNISLSIRLYLKTVLLPISMVIISSIILPLFLYLNSSQSVISGLIVMAVSVLSSLTSIYFFGINSDEKKYVKKIISSHLPFIKNRKD